MAEIYHVTSGKAWQEARKGSEYKAESLEKEGFIHCCELRQLRGVLQRYYSGKKGMIALVIDTDLLTSPVNYETSSSVSELFPHIYGAINVDAVVDTYQLS